MNGVALRDGLRKTLGDDWVVELAMRYGVPSIEAAVARLAEADVERITSSRSSRSTRAPAPARRSRPSTAPRPSAGTCRRSTCCPRSTTRPASSASLAAVARELPEEQLPDHVLISFHGLPERQIRKSDATGAHCFASESLLRRDRSRRIAFCYRAQCAATARALAQALGLRREHWTLSFQSRLGRTPWIKPYTDEVLPELAARGSPPPRRDLSVLRRGLPGDARGDRPARRDQWLALGGEELVLIPCVNAHPTWVATLAEWIRAGEPG